MLRRTATAAATLLAAALTAAGCTAAPAWHSVEVPAGFRPASLAPAGDGLFAGGQSGGTPALVRVDGLRAGAAVDLDPREPAASDADLIWITADGDDLFAVGRWFGGAHSNPRLTMWDGTASSNLLTSTTAAGETSRWASRCVLAFALLHARCHSFIEARHCAPKCFSHT
jgi:hypothetical protein